jgi:hypothetical protein
MDGWMHLRLRSLPLIPLRAADAAQREEAVEAGEDAAVLVAAEAMLRRSFPALTT